MDDFGIAESPIEGSFTKTGPKNGCYTLVSILRSHKSVKNLKPLFPQYVVSR